MTHLWLTVIVVTVLSALMVAVTCLAAWCVHLFKVVLIMLDTSYGWRDSAYILRRARRQQLPTMTSHRITDAVRAEILP